MQIKAETSINQIKLSNLIVENIKLTDLSTIQKQCTQCLQPLKEGEEVLVIFSTKVQLKNNNLQIPLVEPYILHATPKNNRYCAEDFMSRLCSSPEGGVESNEQG
ncbi:MAG: hypothetical protein M0R03_11425 [Novosphingobium sp.]|nr:hypothetical protein [Novosphingobium sp.]